MGDGIQHAAAQAVLHLVRCGLLRLPVLPLVYVLTHAVVAEHVHDAAQPTRMLVGCLQKASRYTSLLIGVLRHLNLPLPAAHRLPCHTFNCVQNAHGARPSTD